MCSGSPLGVTVLLREVLLSYFVSQLSICAAVPESRFLIKTRLEAATAAVGGHKGVATRVDRGLELKEERAIGAFHFLQQSSKSEPWRA